MAGFFVLALIAMIQAFQGKRFKIPVLGDFAEKQAGASKARGRLNRCLYRRRCLSVAAFCFARLLFWRASSLWAKAWRLPVSGSSSSTKRELELALLGEDAVEDHLDAVAGAEAAAGALAHDFVRVFAPGVAVAAQGVDGDEALDEEIGELDEEAVFGGVEDKRGKLVADAVLHEADLLPLDQLALGFGGAALGLAGFVGDLGEFGLGDGGCR